MLKRSLFVLIPCWMAAQVSAGIIYSNFGGGFPADAGAQRAYTSGGAFLGTTFTATAGGNLSTISVDWFGNPSPVSAGLYTNSSGHPGTLLESWNAAVPAGFTPTLTTVTSILQPFLSPGTQYWFVLHQTNSQVEWIANDQGVTGGIWSGSTLNSLSQTFPDFTAPAIQLTSVVPEPATGILLAAGSLVLLLLRRRKSAR